MNWVKEWTKLKSTRRGWEEAIKEKKTEGGEGGRGDTLMDVLSEEEALLFDGLGNGHDRRESLILHLHLPATKT